MELTTRTVMYAILIFLASPWIVFASYLTWGAMIELVYWVKDHVTDTGKKGESQ